MLATARQNARVAEETYGDFRFTLLNFMGAAKQVGDGGPQAYLANVPTAQKVQAHFHPVDQFQVFFGKDDGAFFERKPISGLHVQYSDAYTPYGPFGAGETQLDFFTLRTSATAEHHTMPGSRDKLKGARGRSLQASVLPGDVANGLVHSKSLFEPMTDGMAAHHLQAAAGTSTVGPSPQGSGGQYIVVINGTMLCSAGNFGYQSCLYLGSNDPALQMTAPAEEGFEVLVLQYRQAPGV